MLSCAPTGCRPAPLGQSAHRSESDPCLTSPASGDRTVPNRASVTTSRRRPTRNPVAGGRRCGPGVTRWPARVGTCGRPPNNRPGVPSQPDAEGAPAGTRLRRPISPRRCFRRARQAGWGSQGRRPSPPAIAKPSCPGRWEARFAGPRITHRAGRSVPPDPRIEPRPRAAGRPSRFARPVRSVGNQRCGRSMMTIPGPWTALTRSSMRTNHPLGCRGRGGVGAWSNPNGYLAESGSRCSRTRWRQAWRS